MFYFLSILIAATYFSRPSDIPPNAHTITEITVTFFTPHILAISSLSIFYFSVVPISLRSSPGMVTPMILVSLILSIMAIPDRRPSILTSLWIVKSNSILCTSFSITRSGSCSYHCVAPSQPCFSHSLQ